LRFFERAFALSGCFIEVNDGERPMVVIGLLPSLIFE